MTTFETQLSPISAVPAAYDRHMEDIGYMTCMTLVLLGNYSQTGHFGGPLAYTPYNVAVHLAGPELGGMRYDYRRPKHPYGDKFMLAGGHSVPTCYALWMIMGQALARKFKRPATGVIKSIRKVAMLPVDALGFRRGAGALKTLLQDAGLEDHPLFAQAKGRGIRALAGHAESDRSHQRRERRPFRHGHRHSGRQSRVLGFHRRRAHPKMIAIEGEFAMTEGHAQELKTQALALQVGKRLRVLLSDNNAGIDDSLLGGVIARKYDGYRLVDQWTSYGWNVFTMEDGNDYGQIIAVLKTMEEWDPARPPAYDRDRQDHQRLLAGAVDGKIPDYGAGGGLSPAIPTR